MSHEENRILPKGGDVVVHDLLSLGLVILAVVEICPSECQHLMGRRPTLLKHTILNVAVAEPDPEPCRLPVRYHPFGYDPRIPGFEIEKGDELGPSKQSETRCCSRRVCCRFHPVSTRLMPLAGPVDFPLH